MSEDVDERSLVKKKKEPKIEAEAEGIQGRMRSWKEAKVQWRRQAEKGGDDDDPIQARQW